MLDNVTRIYKWIPSLFVITRKGTFLHKNFDKIDRYILNIKIEFESVNL